MNSDFPPLWSFLFGCWAAMLIAYGAWRLGGRLTWLGWLVVLTAAGTVACAVMVVWRGVP